MTITDLLDDLDRAEVLELLAAAFGSSEAAQRARRRFQERDWAAFGYEEDGTIIGFIGFERLSDSAARIRGIAVAPHHRRMGVGRLLVRGLTARAPGLTIHAETDRDAVDFYRRCGFEVRSLGERFPGVERFECVLR